MPPSVDDVYWYQAIGDVVVPPSSNLQGRVGRTTICKMEILSHVLRAHRISFTNLRRAGSGRTICAWANQPPRCAVWNWKSKI